MATLDQFLPWVSPRVPNCPMFTARQAVLDALIEFCERSLAWSVLGDAQPVINRIATYEVDVPDGARLHLVREVYAANFQLTGKSLEEIARLIPDWQAAVGQPVYYNLLDWDAGELRVYPTPMNQPKSFITVRAAFAPDLLTFKTVPDFLFKRYYRAIAAGARNLLMSMSDQPWSNPAGAGAASAEFEQGITQARGEVLHDGVVGSLSVTPRPFR